jgi:hypothetical protein
VEHVQCLSAKNWDFGGFIYGLTKEKSGFTMEKSGTSIEKSGTRIWKSGEIVDCHAVVSGRNST